MEALGRLSDIARRVEQQQQHQEQQQEEQKQEEQHQHEQVHQEQRQRQGQQQEEQVQQQEQERNPDQEPGLRDQAVQGDPLQTLASCGAEGHRAASGRASGCSGGCGTGSSSSSASAPSHEWREAMDECVVLLLQSAARAREVRGAVGLGAGWMGWGSVPPGGSGSAGAVYGWASFLTG